MSPEEINALVYAVAYRRERMLDTGFPWQRKDVALLGRVQQALDEFQQAENAIGSLRQEVARLTAENAQAWEAAGFEVRGFDKLGSVHDCLGEVKDLLKAIDLIGDGIGGDVGFAVSAVANEAAMTVGNAFDEAATMIEMRRKVVTP